MKRMTADEFSAQLDDGPYAWPGGYPKYFIACDCEAFCFDCAQAERHRIRRAIRRKTNDDFLIIGMDMNWEDAGLTCVHCNRPIDAAYVDVDTAP